MSAAADDWPEYADHEKLFHYIERRASDRKLRLFAVACCRRLWDAMTDARLRDVVEAAEAAADGLISEEEFKRLEQQIVELWATLPDRREGQWRAFEHCVGATRHLGPRSGLWAASFAAGAEGCLAAERGDDSEAAEGAEEHVHIELLRDVFGNLTRPFHFEPRFLAGPAVHLAESIYDERRFEDLPRLGQLLESAGCRDAAVLAHCRRPGPHVRGCWVVDALLQKESAVLTGLITEADWRACNNRVPILHFLRDKGTVRQWRLFALDCCRRISHLITDDRSRQTLDVAVRFADGRANEQAVQSARVAGQQAHDEAKDAEYRAEAEENFQITPVYAAACVRLSTAGAVRSALCRDPRATDDAPETWEAQCWRPSHSWATSAVSMHAMLGGFDHEASGRAEDAEESAQCDALRDVFGDCFGPPGSEGRWMPQEASRSIFGVREFWCQLPTPIEVTLPMGWRDTNSGIIPRLARGIYEDEAFDRLPVLADALEEIGCDRRVIDHIRGPGPHVRGCWVLDRLMGES